MTLVVREPEVTLPLAPIIALPLVTSSAPVTVAASAPSPLSGTIAIGPAVSA
jgi:hypothetical protein